MSDECERCGKEIKINEHFITEAHSTACGTYYKGPGICAYCADVLKERAIAKSEARRTVKR